MIDPRGRFSNKINLIDGAFGLMVLFFFIHILGFTLAVSLPWWLEPGISGLSPSEVFPEDTIRIRGRNFDPRARVQVGDMALDTDAFLTAYAIEFKIPKGFRPGRYPVSVTNRWNRRGSWDGQLEVKSRHAPVVRRPAPMVPKPAASSEPKPASPVIPKPPPPADPKPAISVETVVNVWLESKGKSTHPHRVSLLCFLRVEDVSLEPSFRGFIKNLPKDIRVLALIPERQSFLAKVTLSAQNPPPSGTVTYSLYGHELLKKGLSFQLMDDKNYRVYGVALEDPVPVGANR